MKNIFLIIGIVLFTTTIKSQSVIIDIRDTRYYNTNNTFYDYYQKDLNNLLDPFQGTYIYTNGNTSFKIVLKKMIKQLQGQHFEDLIIGEYQYIENGIEKINTLSNLNVSYSYQSANHGITGNGIIANINNRVWKCPQCNPNEKRLRTSIEDKISGRNADFLMRRTIVNGQEVIQANIQNISSEVVDVDDPSTFNEPPFALPKGEFTMIKQ